MKQLLLMDTKNYDESWRRSTRPSVRGIVERDGKFAMVHSLTYDYYMFPGGGIEENETKEQALIREVREETGLEVIPESIREYGSVMQIRASDIYENTIFEQENFYYCCEVDTRVGQQKLEDYEIEEQFVLEYVLAEEALKTNRACRHENESHNLWIERESKVLELLMQEGIGVKK